MGAVVPAQVARASRRWIGVTAAIVVALAIIAAWRTGVGILILRWLADWIIGFGKLTAPQVALLQTGLAVVGGLWAFYLYRTSRTGQTTISIVPSCWLAASRIERLNVLVIRVRVTNVSKALCHDCRATVTLTDATVLENGQMALPTFATEDPWALLYTDISDSDNLLSLEPGETIDSEAAFFVRRRSLLGVRVLVKGVQGWLVKRPFLWVTFFFVDVAALHRQASGLSSSPQPPQPVMEGSATQ